MAKKIYIASTESLAGKSVVALSLALMAREMGKRVGYFKPIGIESALGTTAETVDEDAETMNKVLESQVPLGLVCPVILRRRDFLEDFSNMRGSEYIDKIIASYAKASQDADIVLIEGPPVLSVGSFLECPVPRLVADLGAELLLVARFRDDFIVDEILQSRDYCMKWGVSLLGVVLNRIPTDKMKRAEKVLRPLLENRGIKVLGLIPEDRVLSFLTVREIYDVIGGKLLAGQDGLDNTVHTVLVGAMTPESATRYFRKAKNELVITGGDRTDIIFAALETGVSALILTGNLYPSVKIFPRADDLAVPIILVPHDTYTTLQHIQGIVGRVKPKDKKRIAIAKKIIKENVDWKKILEAS